MKRIFALLLLLVGVFAADIAVGTYILNIGNYDIAQGTYDADFYLWFRGAEVPETFELMNGDASSTAVVIDEPGYKMYRIRASLYSTPDFRDYPNDRQTLSIMVEDSVNTIEAVNYIEDSETGIDPRLSVLGWEAADSGVRISSSHYANWGESYSRYEHYLTIARPPSALPKILFPVVFIALIGWLAFFVPRRQFEVRATLGFSALLSAVAFHLGISASLPQVGYLTLADAIMIALYSFVVAVSVAVVAVEAFESSGRQRAAVVTNRWALVLLPLAPFIVFWLVSGL